MNRSKPKTTDHPKHAAVHRDAMEDISEVQSAQSPRSEIRYRNPSRDRALGEADRTGRHFDEEDKDADERKEE